MSFETDWEARNPPPEIGWDNYVQVQNWIRKKNLAFNTFYSDKKRWEKCVSFRKNLRNLYSLKRAGKNPQFRDQTLKSAVNCVLKSRISENEFQFHMETVFEDIKILLIYQDYWERFKKESSLV